jgi:hypothetical protein
MLYRMEMPVRNMGGKCPFQIWEGKEGEGRRVFHGRAEEYFMGGQRSISWEGKRGVSWEGIRSTNK